MAGNVTRRLILALGAIVALSTQAQDECDLLFYAPFDGSADAAYAKGTAEPLTVKNVQFVPGLRGQAVRVPAQGVLAYATGANLNGDRGTVSFWLQRPVWSEEELTALRAKFRRRYIFSGDTQRGAMVSARVAFADVIVAELAGAKLVGQLYGSWAPGSWHHVAVTWDKDGDTCLYLDDELVPGGEATLGGLRRHQYPFDPEPVTQMYVGCRGDAEQSDVPIDELRLYGRVLSGDEIRRIVWQDYPLYCRVLPQILAPGRNQLTLSLMNRGREEVKDGLRWEVFDAEQALVAHGTVASLALASGATREVPVVAEFPTPGSYTLAVTSDAEKGPLERFPLYVPAPLHLGKLERDPRPRLEPVDRIDCAEELPPERFMQRGESTVVKSPLGDYREAAHERWSRLVYTINVEAVQEPHLVTIRYPDDKARCAYVMVRSANKKNNYALHAGYSVGAEFPNTGQLQAAHYLWWPMEKRNALMLCTWWADQPAAVKDITVERIVGGIAAVPRLDVAEPKDEPGRLLAIEWEDASLASNFGLDLEAGLDLEGFTELSDRLVAYMGFTGMDTLVYPATFYVGPLCRHPKTTGIGSDRLNLHPEGWLELLAVRLSQAGLAFYPAVNFHSTPTLVESNVDDPFAIAKGADTFYQIPFDGVLPRYTRGDTMLNPLHPRVQQQTLEIIDGIVSRCENHASYHGIQLCFWPYRRIPFCFLDIRHGYGDTTVGRFEKDTGIEVPVSPTDPERFYKRYRFLLEEHREEWVDWRCRKIAEYVEHAAAIVRRKNENARILIPLHQEALPDAPALYRKLSYGRSTCETEWRERGVDMKLLAKIPGVHIQRQMRDDYRRYLHEGSSSKSSRDCASSWEVSKPFREIPSGTYPFNLYYEHPWPETPVPGGWWRDEWSAGTANGGGRYYLERSAWALFLQDAQSLCRGACSVEAQASIWEFREWARAYRPLPAEPFDSWTKSVIEPAAVRQYEGKAGHYVYAVNAMYCPLEVTLELSAPGPVTELATGSQLALDKGTLTVPLRPYELRSFLAAPGTTVADVRVAVPEDVTAGLQQRFADLQGVLDAHRADFSEADRTAHGNLLEEIERHLAARRYYRAWRLLESERADNLLAPPPQDRHAAAATQAGRVPELNGNLFPDGDLDRPVATPDMTGAELLEALGLADRSSGRIDYLNRSRKKGEEVTAAKVELRPHGGHNGSQCLKVDAERDTVFTLRADLAQDVVPGYDYALSFWVRSDRARAVPLMFWVNHGSGKRWNYSLMPALDDQWQQCRVIFSIPTPFPGLPSEGDNSLSLYLWNLGHKRTLFPTAFCIDDIALTCLGRDISCE